MLASYKMNEFLTKTRDKLNSNSRSFWLFSFIGTWSGLWMLGNILFYFIAVEHDFLKLSPKAVLHQKTCLESFLRVFGDNKITVVLFDVEILEELFQLKPKSWHDADHNCKTMCKVHPEDKNLLSFAVRGTHFYEREDRVVEMLKLEGFEVHLTLVEDPRIATIGVTNMIPSHLWAAKNDHVIHVSFLHERIGKFFWIGPVSRREWRDTLGHLDQALSHGWHEPEQLGVHIPRYEQAYEMSHNLLGMPLDIDGHEIMIPYNIKGFLTEQRNAKFIGCDLDRTRRYKEKYPAVLTDADVQFMQNAKKLILRAKRVLDGLNVPFWLSSGTCLGWYRQCDIIPYAGDVDFGIFIRDFNPKMTRAMEREGLMLTHSFGRLNDSFELSFEGEERIKLDLFFFYEEDDYVWNGGTEAHNGQKYKYYFSQFDLCWTEFLETKVRVPCQALEYVKANYGENWFEPVKNWVWYESPPNVEKNGVWPKDQWDEVIQVYEYDE